jgi:heme o synthase
MLPVVRGDRETSRQILLYSIVLVSVTIAPVAWHLLGLVYLAAALALGVVFLYLVWRLQREATSSRAA